MSDDELAAEVLRVLRSDLYMEARRSILRYEIIEGERQTSAIIHLRDAFDHLAQAARHASAEEWSLRIAGAMDHLRKAAVEHVQFGTETRLARIDAALRFYAVKRLVFPELPARGIVQRDLREIKQDLADGRVDKALLEGMGDALTRLNEAHRKAANLSDTLKTGRLALGVRLLAWGVGPVSLVLAVTVLLAA